MINTEKIKVLQQKITGYFQNDDFAISNDIGKSVYELIFENVDCDYSKLAAALDVLTAYKKGNIARDFKQAGNVFDVSRNGAVAPCYVKGFVSNGFPMLYFFAEDERKPSFKIKSQKNQKAQGYTLKCETTIRPEAITSTTAEDGSYFLRLCEINFNDKGFEVIDGMQAKTNSKQETALDKEMLCDDYKMLYTFMENVLEKNKANFLSPLTPTKFDFIYSVFYHAFRGATKYDDEICMTDLVRLMNLVFTGDSSFVGKENLKDSTVAENNFTPAVDIALEDYQASNEHKNVDIELLDRENARMLNFKVTKSEGYMSIHVTDALTNKIYSTYLLGATNNGFTLFRNLANGTNEENQARMFTLNLTDNTFRLSIKRDIPKIKEVSEEVVMKVTPDGELSINSVEYRDVKYKDQSANVADGSELQQKQA